MRKKGSNAVVLTSNPISSDNNKLSFNLFLLVMRLFFYRFYLRMHHPRVVKAKVRKIQDGDTITLSTGEKIRFFGIDAPETFPVAQPYGRVAKERVRELIENSGMTVHLLAVDGSSNTDKYKRSVRVIFVNKDVDLNLLLLREGLAWAYRRYLTGTEFERAYVEAEEEAKREKRGLWSETDDLPINPEKFRRSRKRRDK
jgi:endonuclease YncB( thermonuclease family)